jgi:hypothetical protein
MEELDFSIDERDGDVPSAPEGPHRKLSRLICPPPAHAHEALYQG